MNRHKELIWTAEMVENFWGYYAKNTPLDTYFSFRSGVVIARNVAPYLKGCRRVLDYGCGPGFLLEELLAAGFEVAGTDISGNSRDDVVKRFGHHPRFLGAMSWEELVESDLRFDAVTAIEVVEHLYDEQLDDFLGRLREILVPRGILVLTTPNEEDLEKSYLLCPVTNQLFHRMQHVRSWSRQTLTDYLTARGFDVVACFTTNFNASLLARDAKHPYRKKWSALRLKMKYLVNPGRHRPHLVAVARLRSDGAVR